MNKTPTFLLASTGSVIFFIYLLTILFQSQFWGNVLSPFISFLSSGCLFYIFWQARHKNYLCFSWLFLCLACFSWGIADTLWAVDTHIIGTDPNLNLTGVYLYACTNLFLFTATVIFSVYQYKKWIRIKTVLDVLTITTVSSYSLWIIFFKRSFTGFQLLAGAGFLSLSCVVLDICLMITILIWYVSIRKGRIPFSLRLISAGLSLFAIFDLWYYYLQIYNLYMANSITDALYAFPLYLIAIGGILYQRKKDTLAYTQDVASHKDEMDNYTNIGFRHKGLLIFIAPALVALWDTLSITDVLFYTVIIYIYEGLCGYFDSATKTALLLEKEKELNNTLEKHIAARTSELVDKNRQLMAMNITLDRLSNQDTVTDLNNGRYLARKIDEIMATLSPKERLVMLYIDLDRFKNINDTHGHAMGNKVLIEIGKRLKEYNQDRGIIARMGGDEFALVFAGNYDYKKAYQMGQQIINKCAQVIEIDEYNFYVTLSVGISVYPLDADNANMLMKNVDIAMYQAKAAGNNRCFVFNSTLNEQIQWKHTLEYSLRNADVDKEFLLLYQPQFSIPNKKLIGMEALIRWNHPTLGCIMPMEFIPVAEETVVVKRFCNTLTQSFQI